MRHTKPPLGGDLKQPTNAKEPCTSYCAQPSTVGYIGDTHVLVQKVPGQQGKECGKCAA